MFNNVDTQAELLPALNVQFSHDPQRMMQLRSKFVKQCKKYIGVPYKQKYHKAGSKYVCCFARKWT